MSIHRSASSRIALLLDELADGLVRAVSALVVELGTARGTLLDDLDRLEPGAVEREALLNADTHGVAADDEVAGDCATAVVDREHLALKILDAELVAFLDLDGDADDVAGAELGELLLRKLRSLLGVDLVYKLDTHGLGLLLRFDLLRRSRVVRLQVGVLRATDERGNRSRGLGALREPVLDAREVELEVLVLDLGVVPPEDLEELAVTGRTGVRRHNTIGRVVRATGATHSDLDHFFFLLVNERRVVYQTALRNARANKINEFGMWYNIAPCKQRQRRAGQ